MTELSFLIELLLHHELKSETKDLIAKRIQEVEEALTKPRVPQIMNMQPPSTLAAMAKHAEAINKPSAEIPVEMIAQTPQTAAAMERHSLVINGKNTFDPSKGGPRKW